MYEYQTRTFIHKGNKYEIRVVSDGHTIRVRCFLNGKPANGYSYAVEIPAQIDANMNNGVFNPVEELIKTAEYDVKNGVWDQYVAAVQGTHNGD